MCSEGKIQKDLWIQTLNDYPAAKKDQSFYNL